MTRAALVLAAVLGLAACGNGAAAEVEVIDDRRVPFALLEDDEAPPTTTTTAPPGSVVRRCFLDPAGAIRDVPERLDLRDGAISAVRSLARPPADLATAVPDPAPVRSVQVEGGVAAVDLDESFGELGTEPQQLAIAQIVCTVTSLPGIGQVRFALAGNPIDVPDGDGVLTPGPVSRDDYRTLLAPPG